MSVKEIFDRYGVTCSMCKKRGLKYQTAYAHLKGYRRVTPQQAVAYEQKVGIPRTEFYPLAFWLPAAAEKALAPSQA
jgi:hypothetical protein